MEYPLKIPAKELCRILTAPDDKLSLIDDAVKRLLQSMYSRAELKALEEHACLTETLGPVDIGAVSPRPPRRL